VKREFNPHISRRVRVQIGDLPLDIFGEPAHLISLFEMGVRAVKADPSLVQGIVRTKTRCTTIWISPEQWIEIGNLGLTPREAIQIGISRARQQLEPGII
jgi:hypothetical protein